MKLIVKLKLKCGIEDQAKYVLFRSVEVGKGVVCSIHGGIRERNSTVIPGDGLVRVGKRVRGQR